MSSSILRQILERVCPDGQTDVAHLVLAIWLQTSSARMRRKLCL